MNEEKREESKNDMSSEEQERELQPDESVEEAESAQETKPESEKENLEKKTYEAEEPTAGTEEIYETEELELSEEKTAEKIGEESKEEAQKEAKAEVKEETKEEKGGFYTEIKEVKSVQQLIDTLNSLLRESTVRRIKVKNREGRVLLDIPVWLAAVGSASAIITLPFLSAIGLLAGIVSGLTIEVERVREE